MKDDEGKIREWMMFNFYSQILEKESKKKMTDEGKLEWHPIEEITTFTDG